MLAPTSPCGLSTLCVANVSPVWLWKTTSRRGRYSPHPRLRPAGKPARCEGRAWPPGGAAAPRPAGTGAGRELRGIPAARTRGLGDPGCSNPGRGPGNPGCSKPSRLFLRAQISCYSKISEETFKTVLNFRFNLVTRIINKLMVSFLRLGGRQRKGNTTMLLWKLFEIYHRVLIFRKEKKKTLLKNV